LTDTFIVGVFREALWLVLLTAAPMLGAGLLVGLVISIFQATTQIQEQTLSFVPKIIAILAVMVIFFPWMMHLINDFASKIFGNLNQFTFIKLVFSCWLKTIGY
jgi:flagellar biosynthetic protein FliQ